MKIKTLVFAISLVGAASTAAWAQDSSMAQTAAVDADMYQAAIDNLNQISGRYDTGLTSNWVDYVTVHGGAYVDAAWGDQTQDTAGLNDNRTSVTNAYLAVEAAPTDWSKFDFALNYSDASSNYENPSDDSVYVDQAYLTLGNPNRYPLFLQAGQQYVPFGHYSLYPIVKSMGQVMSEANQTDFQAGFVLPKGLYGSAYTFQNTLSQGSSSNTAKFNYGATLGFNKSNDRMNVDLGVGYIDNMVAVTGVEDALNASGGSDVYATTVQGASVYVDFTTGPFGLQADYVTAMDDFAASDINYKSAPGSLSETARPSAGDITASYDFNKKGMDQQVYVGYQASSEASGLDLPENRYLAGYNIYPWSNVLLGAEITRDTNYDSDYVYSNGDTAQGDDYYTYNLRVGVQF